MGDFDLCSVKRRTFIKVCEDCGVFISNHDLHSLEAAFGVGDGEIDCEKMGRQLGLDS